MDKLNSVEYYLLATMWCYGSNYDNILLDELFLHLKKHPSYHIVEQILNRYTKEELFLLTVEDLENHFDDVELDLINQIEECATALYQLNKKIGDDYVYN
jgi:hypothetical protein